MLNEMVEALRRLKSARGATDETKMKAANVFYSMSNEEQAMIRKLGKFDKPAYITRRGGNESEKAGVNFGLFPLWSAIVEDLLDEGDEEKQLRQVAQDLADATARHKARMGVA